MLFNHYQLSRETLTGNTKHIQAADLLHSQRHRQSSKIAKSTKIALFIRINPLYIAILH